MRRALSRQQICVAEPVRSLASSRQGQVTTAASVQSIDHSVEEFSDRPCAPSASSQAPTRACDAPPWRLCSAAVERVCAVAWKTLRRCRGRALPKRAATRGRANAIGSWRAQSRLDRGQQRKLDLCQDPKNKWSAPSPLIFRQTSIPARIVTAASLYTVNGSALLLDERRR